MEINPEQDITIFKNTIIPMIHEMLYSSKYSHDIVFRGDREKDDILAGIFINDASSYSNTAKMYYLLNPDFEREEFDNLFNSFETYRGEILDNIRTKHSHQWTDIEYLKFAESAKLLANLLDMNTENLYKDL